MEWLKGLSSNSGTTVIISIRMITPKVTFQRLNSK
jgi:hypothetical protein